jgi:hypothetical protein
MPPDFVFREKCEPVLLGEYCYRFLHFHRSDSASYEIERLLFLYLVTVLFGRLKLSEDSIRHAPQVPQGACGASFCPVENGWFAIIATLFFEAVFRALFHRSAKRYI